MNLGPHSGIDLAAPRYEQIYNCAPGTVIAVGTTGSWGHQVKIMHADGSVTGYAHMTAGSIQVGINEVISGTKVIGQVGTTGVAEGPHLHLTLQPSLNGAYVAPDDIVVAGLAPYGGSGSSPSEGAPPDMAVRLIYMQYLSTGGTNVYYRGFTGTGAVEDSMYSQAQANAAAQIIGAPTLVVNSAAELTALQTVLASIPA